jgi:hypothetical protein
MLGSPVYRARLWIRGCNGAIMQCTRPPLQRCAPGPGAPLRSAFAPDAWQGAFLGRTWSVGIR